MVAGELTESMRRVRAGRVGYDKEKMLGVGIRIGSEY